MNRSKSLPRNIHSSNYNKLKNVTECAALFGEESICSYQLELVKKERLNFKDHMLNKLKALQKKERKLQLELDSIKTERVAKEKHIEKHYSDINFF